MVLDYIPIDIMIHINLNILVIQIIKYELKINKFILEVQNFEEMLVTW